MTITLNVAGDISFNCLNLSQIARGHKMVIFLL